MMSSLKAETTTSSRTLKPITVQLKWKHQFQFAGFYAAIEQGFYQEVGFKVTLKEADYMTNPIEEVLSGRADYGVANSELMLYRMNGEPVTVLAALIQHSPIVLMSLKRSNILSPQDLIGKKIMYPEGHYGANTLGILLKEGIEQDQIESVPLSFNINDLIEGKVDAMVGYVTDQPYALKTKNIEYNLIHPRSYGIDFYGDTLFTREIKVSKVPKEVVEFRNATLKGWKYAVDHPRETIDLILNQYKSEKNRGELQHEANETIKLIVPELVEIGHMNPGRWQHIAKTFSDLGLAHGKFLDDGFMFAPEKQQADLTLKIVIRIALTLFFVGGGFILLLTYFNKKLKQAVNEKTTHLTETNERLLSSTKQLSEKEAALNTLNHELEQRISYRTESLNRANTELFQEINHGKKRELSLQLLSKAIENSSSAVLIVDSRQIISYASSAFLRLMGLLERELTDQPIHILEGKLSLPVLSNTHFHTGSQSTIQHELECSGLEGKKYWLQTTISPLWTEDEKVSHFVMVFEDVTDLKQRKDEMEKIALYDPLTGLENRVLFRIRLEKAIQRATQNKEKTALLFVDVDNFKEVNDTSGHEAGDIVLKTISERLKTHVRKNDTVARVSGDEFTVLLSDINNYDDASKVTNSIIESFQHPIRLKNTETFVTVSIGISVTPDDSINMDELIKNADLAMYKAKKDGRNNFQFFCQDMNVEVTRKATIERELRGALENKSFFLRYQPKILFGENRIVGAEALIRWQYSDDTVKNPDDFIPVAEDTGLIIPMGRWVIKQAINDIRLLLDSCIERIKISVNISPRQIKDSNFVVEIRELFSDIPEFIQYFEFEITENAFIDNQLGNISRLNELRDMGFSISIDDFGTGYSSLSYLKRLPIDTIKIDRTFVQDLPGDKDSAEITNAVIAMSHKLNLAVVAEGVENLDQARFLEAISCDIAQGFHYGQPMSLERLMEKFLTNSR